MYLPRETCCAYNNELYPVDVLVDTMVAEDNCTSVRLKYLNILLDIIMSPLV